MSSLIDFFPTENVPIPDQQNLLLKANLKQLRLPTISAECDKLAREATESNERYETYLLRLTELEVASRQANALQARIKTAGFPVHKDFDTFDFTVSETSATGMSARSTAMTPK